MSESQISVNPRNFNVKGPVLQLPPNWNANALKTNELLLRTDRVPEWDIKENEDTNALDFYYNGSLVYSIPAPSN